MLCVVQARQLAVLRAVALDADMVAAAAAVEDEVRGAVATRCHARGGRGEIDRITLRLVIRCDIFTVSPLQATRHSLMLLCAWMVAIGRMLGCSVHGMAPATSVAVRRMAPPRLAEGGAEDAETPSS